MSHWKKSEYCEANDNKFNTIYFNWTWIYKIKSYITMGYIPIQNTSLYIIDLKEGIDWLKIDEMGHVNVDVLDN